MTEELFAAIMQRNEWSSTESISGTGSTLEQTAHLRGVLPALLERLEIRTLLDLPCGDFNWISHVKLPVETYIGGDIVEHVVQSNRERFGRDANPRRTFVRLDMTADPLPAVDLVLCRDCLVHFSYEDIWRAMRQLRNSGAIYLLTTLNVMLPPFSLPAPIEIINERCTEADGKYADKSLGLWRIRDLPVGEELPRG